MSKCCGKSQRIFSNTTENLSKHCHDVCQTPSCGEPFFLSTIIPVCYDEIGINVCRSISIADLVTRFPTTAYVNVEILDITYATTGDSAVTVVKLPARPNCYEIVLRNLNVTFAVSLYDCCMRLLGTEPVTGVTYLPPNTDPAYDADTNPSAVTLNIFAPYGVSHASATDVTPTINVVTSSVSKNMIAQGLNLMGIPKVLNFDVADNTITVGLTLIMDSMYYMHYQLPHKGKTNISKGKLAAAEDSICMDFVSGSLLDMSIKPLEFPCEQRDKKPCPNDSLDPCNENAMSEDIMDENTID